MKRFWDMSEEEVDQAVARMGMEQWRDKVLQDRSHAAEELASGPNPWAEATFSERRQRIIQSLAPEVAEAMRRNARAH
jgi:hypothetical protein